MLVDEGKYYLYRHIRLDKNEPFYIGIGNNLNKKNLLIKEHMIIKNTKEMKYGGKYIRKHLKK